MKSGQLGPAALPWNLRRWKAGSLEHYWDIGSHVLATVVQRDKPCYRDPHLNPMTARRGNQRETLFEH